MSDQLIEFFLAKEDAFDVLTKRVEDRLRTIHEVSQMFKDHPWRWVSVIGAGGFPSEVTETELKIDANQWRTGKEIGDLLASWHHADHAYRDAWARLTPQQQKQLQTLQPETARPPSKR
jgi:hypothetical protein